MINEKQKQKIIQIINVAESSVPDGNYAKVTIANDGPKNVRQISYGRSQVTEFNGLLKELIELYIKNGGSFGAEFEPYISRIGIQPSLAGDPRFVTLLKNAGLDPVMKKTQDFIFEERYWKVTERFAKKWGLILPLSWLVLYDTIIHSGPSLESPRSIVPYLRRRFSEPIPAKGGDEKAWIEGYVNARHNWLKNNKSKPILRRTIYRTQCFLENIKNNNWDLHNPVIMNGVTII